MLAFEMDDLWEKGAYGRQNNFVGSSFVNLTVTTLYLSFCL